MTQQLQTKHVPMRTCIVTRKKFPKNELVRIVKTKTGEVQVDATGKLSGRGANICMDIQVFEQAIKRGAFKHALKLDKQLDQKQIDQLRQQFSEYLEEKKLRPVHNKPIKVRISKDKYLEMTGQKTVSGI